MVARAAVAAIYLRVRADLVDRRTTVNAGPSALLTGKTSDSSALLWWYAETGQCRCHFGGSCRWRERVTACRIPYAVRKSSSSQPCGA